MKTAILIDGEFFLRKHKRHFPQSHQGDPVKTAEDISFYARRHISEGFSLYRIFFYDCPPLTKRHHLPISKKAIDFSKTKTAQFRFELFEQLKQKRKIALRLGELRDGDNWKLNPLATKQLLTGKRTLNDLTDDDFSYDVRQKAVDAKLGIDITTLALKQQVSQIVLIAGDSDFVPAAKLARREGIDFILDPMWSPIGKDLIEHIDGLSTKISKQPQQQ